MSSSGTGRLHAARAARVALRLVTLLVTTAAVALLALAQAPSTATAGRTTGPAAQAAATPRVELAAYLSARSGSRAVHFAAAQRGKPYRYGAAGPHAFDCSGLTHWVYDVKLHRHIPRTSAAQYRASHHIAKRSIRRGDLVFFVRGGHVYHVGIYAGGHRIWHAPHTGARVRLEHIWTSHWRAGRVR